MNRRPFREIAAARLADPIDRALIDAEVQAILASLGLADLRLGRGATQSDVARALGTTQENVSRIERRDDVHLSTLGRYVTALGGRLEVNAVFPDRTVPLLAGTDAAGKEDGSD